MEIWKPVLGFERYVVSCSGDIKNSQTGNQLTTHVNRATGYVQVSIRKPGELKTYALKIHRAVYEAFVRPLQDKEEIDHIDYDKTNNHIDNLRACSRTENLHRRRLKNMTGYRGVYKMTCRKKVYFSRVVKDQKYYSLGYFHSPEEAAKAYNKKALELFGEFAVLNEVP